MRVSPTKVVGLCIGGSGHYRLVVYVCGGAQAHCNWVNGTTVSYGSKSTATYGAGYELAGSKYQYL